TNSTTAITAIAVGRSDHFMLSLDDGLSFKRILYPIHEGFLNIGALSKDALNYFFVAQDGVYRYSIADNTWVVIRLYNTVSEVTETLLGMGSSNASHFLNAEVFSFVFYYDD